jgi:hypothetical protein
MFRPRKAPAVVALSLAAVAFAVPAAQAGGGSSAPRPAPLAPPEGHRLVATYLVGTGSQVYECLPDAATGGNTWRGRPVAVLVAGDNGGAAVGTHDSVAAQGLPSTPQWALVQDGARVAARLATGGTFPAPDPTKAIPALKLDVTQNSGVGRWAGVTLIQRDLTRGGVGPSGACNPATDATTVRNYSARYTFWAPAS